MNLFQSIMAIAPTVIFVLGIINLVTGVMVLFSCRCIAGAKITGKLMGYPAYQSFYQYHCYIWWVFWTSVIVHAILAILVFGIPF